MRTTVQLDDDVAAAIEDRRRARDIGLSDAVNELVREGLAARRPRRRTAVPTRPLGLRIDVSNVAEALEQLEGTHFR